MINTKGLEKLIIPLFLIKITFGKAFLKVSLRILIFYLYKA
jgi:hypothetical protein